jgi:hypothetical protein
MNANELGLKGINSAIPSQLGVREMEVRKQSHSQEFQIANK